MARLPLVDALAASLPSRVTELFVSTFSDTVDLTAYHCIVDTTPLHRYFVFDAWLSGALTAALILGVLTWAPIDDWTRRAMSGVVLVALLVSAPLLADAVAHAALEDGSHALAHAERYHMIYGQIGLNGLIGLLLFGGLALTTVTRSFARSLGAFGGACVVALLIGLYSEHQRSLFEPPEHQYESVSHCANDPGPGAFD